LEAHCRGRSSDSDRVLIEASTKSIALKYDRGPWSIAKSAKETVVSVCELAQNW
jgi:hypothetical protein